jgi:hypothetical protein
MKFNLLALACALMLAFGLSMGSFAGSITDADGDGVPDGVDNCINVANGPLATEGSSSCDAQQDGDEDGFGNSCDSDFNNDGAVGLDDVNQGLGAVGSNDPEVDGNCDGAVGLDDVNVFLNSVGQNPGPSGLSCVVPVPGGVKGSCPPE